MLLVVISIAIFGTVTTATLALLRRERAPTIESRMQDFRNRTVTGAEQELDLEVPFFDRVVRPAGEAVARTASAVLPQSVLADIQRQLVTAGTPMRLNGFVTFWMSCMAIFGGMGLMVLVAFPGGPQKLLAAGVFLVMGWMIPRAWLKGKVKAKQKAVLRALPDGLDLITTCVEAGLGLDAALARVAEKSSGPLSDELGHMLRDVAMGKLRREALSELAERVDLEELTNFVNSVIQAEQLGVSIAQVLRVQSDQMRTKRRQRAEQSAHEAPIKMLFPLVLFIFPAFLIIVLGPAGIRLSQSLAK